MRSMPVGSNVTTIAIVSTLLVALLTAEAHATRRGWGLFRRGRAPCTCPQKSAAAGDEAPAEPGAATDPAPSAPERSPSDATANQAPTSAWRSLLAKDALAQWESTRFGGEGDVEILENQLLIGLGSSLSGAHFTGEIPRMNYEVEYEARRLDGIDFFCGFTFPVAESYCSFIAGGWAGGVVGLSSIDGRDASENSTTKYMTFKNDQWYRFRVRVTTDAIETWIDEDPVVYQSLEGHKISTRAEVDPSQPFGFATWETKGEIRNLRIRTVDDGK